MGLRGSGSSADPGSWSTFSGSPASIQLLPTAPPRGVPTSTAGGGKGGGPELAEIRCGREQACTKVPQAEAGGRSRNLIS